MGENKQGIFVPEDILTLPDIGWADKIILSLIASQKPFTWSNQAIADYLNLSVGRVSKIIRHLAENDYVSIGYDYRKTPMVRDLWLGKWAKTAMVQNDHVTYSFKVLNNNFFTKDLNQDLGKNLKKDLNQKIKNKSRPREDVVKNDMVENDHIENDKVKRFKAPTVEDVQAYCLERANNVDPRRWHDYYMAKGWKVGKAPMKDWRAAVRTWERERGSAAPAPVSDIDQALAAKYAQYSSAKMNAEGRVSYE